MRSLACRRGFILERILGALAKPNPDHLQVVGPRFAGKTVILHELARRLRDQGAPYTAVLLWDLGHQTPATDELFMQRFAQELAGVLALKHSDYADHLRLAEGNPYSEIAEVLDLLKDEEKILTIMDGFDKPLSNGQLTRNLWDQLRELALKPSLRIITASRRTLRDLIRNPDAQTSDFWGIFEPIPVRVGCFDDADIAFVLAQFDSLEVAGGAKTELLNATNGFPVLLLEALNVVQDEVGAGKVKPESVVSACEKILPRVSDIIEMLWVECTPTSQDLLWRVLEEQTVVCKGIANADVETLVERGFVRRVENKLQRPNRLLIKFLEGRPHEGNALIRLFGSAEVYQRHLKGVMELRIDQLAGIDSTLKRYLQLGAEQFPAHPKVFLSNIRGIVDHAFDLIWKAELKGKRIPSDWMVVWKRNKERGVEDWETMFPQGGHRLRLLNLMTGTQKSNPCAEYITKSTYALMNSAYAFGEFGQHQEGAIIDPATAYAALLLCIELAASVTRELPAG